MKKYCLSKMRRQKDLLLQYKFSGKMIKPKLFFYIVWSSFAVLILWLQLAATQNVSIIDENVIKEALQNFTDKSKSAEIAPTTKLSDDLKYMLIWNQRDWAPLNNNYFRDGQDSFILNDCSFTNCYVTTDRNFFGGNITKFDAIAFNGRNIKTIQNDFPKERSPHQKYIYFNMESADNFPVCHSAFDNFFNWSATYKLDSDILFLYLLIKKDGAFVGSAINMDWQTEYPKVSDEHKFNKTKAAAWFVSHCHTRSKREDVVAKWQKALKEYGNNIDIYGDCGSLKCPRKQEACNKKLEEEYYFYLSLENSFSEDYVTEKLLTALLNNAVPIVYGGANYSRFLPPNSYIDAQKHNASSLAALMDQLIRSPSLYAEYFRWKQVYEYIKPVTTVNVCNVCAALSDKEKFNEESVYTDFRKWWLGANKFKSRC